jgi:type I restriction enzyme S subunit
MERELPEGWLDLKFKEIVKYKKGKKPQILKEEKFKDSVPYLDIKALEFGEIRQYADIQSSNLIESSSIAIVWDGARSGWVSKAPYGAMGSTIASLTPVIANVDYVYYYLRSQFNFLNTNTRGSGIPHVDPETLWNLDFPCAPLAEQKRIVAKLDKAFQHLDTLKAKLDRIPELLKNFRQAVLTQAVTGKLTEEWREENNEIIDGNLLIENCFKERQHLYCSDRTTFLKPPNFYITQQTGFPNNWCFTYPELIASPEKYSLSIGPFGSNLKVIDYKDSGIPLIFVRHIRANSFEDLNPKYVSEEKAKELNAHSIEPLDLLITKMGDPPGDCEIYPAHLSKAIITADCLKFRVWDKYYDREFYKLSINSFFVKEQLGLITKGVAQQKISLERFKTILLPVPTLEEQKEIVKKVEDLFAKADAIEAYYTSLKEKIDNLPQALLAKAFRGELVSQDSNDEPSSILLERIKAVKNGEVKIVKGQKAKSGKGQELELFPVEK